MECGKGSSSSSEKKRITGIQKRAASKCSILGERKAKKELMNYEFNKFSSKGKLFKQSMIPTVKCEKNTCEFKDILGNQRQFSSSSRHSSTSLVMSKQNEDLNKKLKLLEEKEKSISEYYFKIENMIRNFALQKENDKSFKHKPSTARQMTSDPSVFNKTKVTDDILLDFENNLRQISDIWLKTSNDLSNTLKNLKNNPSVDPKELGMENIRIQLAIKQAKSLTLVKTRNIITEAKKLLFYQEIIRRELENLLNHENLKSQCDTEIKNDLKEKEQKITVKSIEKPKLGGTGDSCKEIDMDNRESSRGMSGSEDNEREKETVKKHLNRLTSEKDFLTEVEKSSSDETLKEQNESDESQNSPPKIFTGMELCMKELEKKNKTIIDLNSKIFELQKACYDNSLKYNKMQVTLAEFHEKTQWNQVLWRQIRKLKDQIKSLQESNNQLESQKQELEGKIIRLDQELSRLIKINHFLNQKKYSSISQDLKECIKSEKEHTKTRKKEEFKKMENEFSTDEKIIAEKQNAINQLKKILNAMIDQENFAHKQISRFQSKIEELEKNSKA